MKNKSKFRLLGFALLLSIFFNFILCGKNQEVESKPTAYGFVPQSQSQSITVRLQSIRRIVNNSVGNEWRHYGVVNGKLVDRNRTAIVTVDFGEQLRIESVSEELDKYTDVGRKDTLIAVSDLGTSGLHFYKTVKVVENAGRYAGNIALWRFEYRIEVRE